MKNKRIISFICIFSLMMAAGAGLYISDYYRGSEVAAEAMVSGEIVSEKVTLLSEWIRMDSGESR